MINSCTVSASQLGIVSNGQPCAVDVVLGYPQPLAQQQTAHQTITNFPTLQKVQIQLPATPATQLKVWTHQLTPDGRSAGMAAQASVQMNGDQSAAPFELPNGQLLLPLSSPLQRVEIHWKVPKPNG